jgi:hypothetical protein
MGEKSGPRGESVSPFGNVVEILSQGNSRTKAANYMESSGTVKPMKGTSRKGELRSNRKLTALSDFVKVVFLKNFQ